tara:strand:+ start:836 stop:1069 length:234 start_codon:yes stop_codon:yes gene_type:complete
MSSTSTHILKKKNLDSGPGHYNYIRFKVNNDTVIIDYSHNLKDWEEDDTDKKSINEARDYWILWANTEYEEFFNNSA